MPFNITRTEQGASALDAVTQNVDWALAQGERLTREEPVLSVERMRKVQDVLLGRHPLEVPSITTLVSLMEKMKRMGIPSIPQVAIADTTLAILALRESRSQFPYWSYNHSIDPGLLEEIGYRAISDGLRNDYTRSRVYWQSHIQAQKVLFENAANLADNHEVVAIAGVGWGHDSHLDYLASRFRRVIAMDIDDMALKEAKTAVGDVTLRSRIEPRVLEVSGFIFPLIREVIKILQAEHNPQVAAQKITELVLSVRMQGTPTLLKSGEQANLFISDMLLDQISAFPGSYIERAYQKRYPGHTLTQVSQWQLARTLLAHLMHQEHIHALGSHAPLVVLTSDISKQPYYVTSGVISPLADRKYHFGSQLSDHIPSTYEVVEKSGWTWTWDVSNRTRFRDLVAREGGTILSVHGVEGSVLRPRSHPGWHSASFFGAAAIEAMTYQAAKKFSTSSIFNRANPYLFINSSSDTYVNGIYHGVRTGLGNLLYELTIGQKMGRDQTAEQVLFNSGLMMLIGNITGFFIGTRGVGGYLIHSLLTLGLLSILRGKAPESWEELGLTLGGIMIGGVTESLIAKKLKISNTILSSLLRQTPTLGVAMIQGGKYIFKGLAASFMGNLGNDSILLGQKTYQHWKSPDHHPQPKSSQWVT